MDEDIYRWWLERVGEKRWMDLTDEQRSLLSAWYMLALTEPPSPSEELPIECRTVLSQLVAITHRDTTNSRTRKFPGTITKVPGSVAKKPSVRVTPRWKG